jgi:ribosomal protein S18 acetylase RimI-like enzyme
MPSPPITIRPATPADFPAAARIYVLAEDDVMRRQHDRPSRIEDSETAADEALARYDLQLFHDDNPAQVQVAVAADRPDDDVLGVAAFWVRDHWWYLDYLYVDPGSQNRGIGRALIERCHALGQEAGCSVFSLFASSDPRAIYRYIRLGLSLQPPALNLQAASESLTLPEFPWDDGLDALPLSAAEPDFTARLETLGDLDKAVRGTRRTRDLERWLRDGATGSLLTRRDTGAPAGYFLLQPKINATAARIGPLVALDLDRVPDVVTRALSSMTSLLQPGLTWKLSVPGENTAALAPLVAAGFRPHSLATYLASSAIGQWDRYIFRDEDFL